MNEPLAEKDIEVSNSAKNSNRGGRIWVEFKGHRRAAFMNPYEFPFKRGDIAVVEADRGEDAGTVRHVISSVLNKSVDIPEFSVIRRATTQDHERLNLLRNREKEAKEICQRKIGIHKLPMNLVDSEYRFDGLKLIFYFTADGRVDFRELVKDLASSFRTRIELRQIGSRDEAKRIDSFGVCGYCLCCVSHLNYFQPITTTMAKAQNLILNPSKLSGLCGKLKCCLGYEYDHYERNDLEKPKCPVTEPDVKDSDIDNLSD